MTLFASPRSLEVWFTAALGQPTAVQQAAWPVVRAGRHALMIAATGQGKSLAAWLPLVERIVERLDSCPARAVRALHIAPLKALARDMTANLEPLLDQAGRLGVRPVTIALRCGDTPPAERARQRSRPPEILSTTPESLFVLLGSAGGRRLLRTVEAVVVDELHALVGSKRGAHLALSLARLDELAQEPVQRIGLSATARPAGRLGEFLAGGADCEIVEPGPPGGVDLRIELPEMRLGPFPTTTHWAQIHARIAAMVMADRCCRAVWRSACGSGQRTANGVEESAAGAASHREVADSASPSLSERTAIREETEESAVVAASHRVADASGRPDGGEVAPRSLLVFCQTRAQVERSAAALDEILSEAGMPGQVGAHHGSLDTAHRESIEARFKAGELRVLVSSASLELGLDLGHVDRVCQLGVPGSVNLVRQRAGRSGHRPGKTPRMHLFALTLNQLVEAEALRGRLAAGVIEASCVPDGPADVLAQHLPAMAASGIECADAMLEIVRAASPYRRVGRETLDRLLGLQAEPVADLPGEQSVPLLSRSSDGRVRVHSSAQRLVLTNAGTIPEFFEYDVVRADSGERVGTLDEEFAFESSPGQVVQLGRRSWRILRVSTGRVEVEPVDEDAVELPFWFGEGPGRSPEMAAAMLEAIARRGSSGLHPQAVDLLRESRDVLGALPSPERLVIERFPDPNGDRHVVLHTFAGARINRAWGLALRKRFCRQFNFELQAAATDDGILISLGVTSRFEPAEVARFVKAHTVADVLTQALLDTPLFLTRFRWVANNALVLLKNDLHGRVPPQRQRSQAENLVACVFPDQLACLENLSGPRDVPDHPLVQQALADCLHDYMDLAGLETLLGRIESGALAVHAVDTAEPSPLARALIHAPRHSYLDEAAAEERRTRNFEARSGRPARRAMSAPDPVARSRPAPGAGLRPSPDALERLLLEAGFLTAAEGERGVGLTAPIAAGGWAGAFSRLLRDRRAVSASIPGGGTRLWAVPERLDWLRAAVPTLEIRPWIAPALLPEPSPVRDEAVAKLVAARRRIDGEAAGDRLAAMFAGTGAGRVEPLDRQLQRRVVA